MTAEIWDIYDSFWVLKNLNRTTCSSLEIDFSEFLSVIRVCSIEQFRLPLQASWIANLGAEGVARAR